MPTPYFSRMPPPGSRLQANPQASTFGTTLVATATPRRYSCVWPALGGLFAHLELLGVPPMSKNQTPRRRKRRPIPVTPAAGWDALLRQAQSLGFRYEQGRLVTKRVLRVWLDAQQTRTDNVHRPALF